MAQHPDHQAANQPLQDSANAASTRGESPSASTQQHRDAARKKARVFVLTVSDTRDEKSDAGGALARQLLKDAGHEVIGSRIVPDVEIEITRAVAAVRDGVNAADAIVITGGTGIGPRDMTPEALRPLLTKELPGFGELFRILSWNEIGAAAMMSRAFAGVIGRTIIFALPGSPDAVRLAVEKLIAPELSHLVSQVRG